MQRRVGVMLQDAELPATLTVGELLRQGASYYPSPRSVGACAVVAGVDDLLRRRYSKLSGGQQQRAQFALALVGNPRLLLLDEPTVGLDPEQRLDLRELLRDLGTDACVLVSTHLVEDVVAACTEVVLVNEGRLLWQGTPDALEAQGDGSHPGDSPAERGYSALLRRHRAEAAR